MSARRIRPGSIEAQSAYQPSGLFDRIRFWLVKLICETMLVVMVRDAAWQDPLFASLAPKANSRILSFGRGSVSVARALALRFPEASVIGADPNPRAVESARRRLGWRDIPNLQLIEAPLRGRISLDGGSFDKVVLVLMFYNRLPKDKTALAKEMRRLLRHGGTLHVVAYDKPAFPKERALLTLTRYFTEPAAADPHLDGSWPEFLEEASFAGKVRQSSFSIGVARISVVKARKP